MTTSQSSAIPITGLDELLQSRPWLTEGLQLPASPVGMLGPRESLLCYYLAKGAFKGSGTIVDGGSFLGKSAYYFAEGLRANPRYAAGCHRIHCFDNFLVNEDATVQFVRKELNRTIAIGDSTRELFAAQVSSVSDMLEIHAGDLHTASWVRQPIEILMVDIAKSPSLGRRVVEVFFSSLMPGESLVIHQDYHHPWLPHIHVTMEYLSDYFDLVVPRVDDSAVFRYRSAIPPDILQRAVAYDFSPEERIRLMDRAISRLPEDDRYYVRLARVVLQFGETHETDLRTELDGLRRQYEATAGPNCAPERYFAEVADYLDELEGWRAISERDYERCLRLADKAIAQRPGFYSMSMRGVALRRLGRYAEAEEQLREALKVGSPAGYPSCDAWCELALVLSDQERHAEAEMELVRGLRDRNARPTSEWYCDTLLSVWSRSQPGRNKTVLLAELHRELPRDPEVYVLEAWLRRKDGDNGGADASLREAARLGLSRERVKGLRKTMQLEKQSGCNHE
jgi:tetratricopeptide (TPR) repeat protein